MSRTTCYMWNENVAAQSGQEITFYINKHLHELPNDKEKINFFDCYPCLNRHIYIGIMFLAKVLKFLSKRSVLIHQKFFEPGYTNLHNSCLNRKDMKKRNS